MASSPLGKNQEDSATVERAIVERAVRRLYGRKHLDPDLEQNASALVQYLVKSGIHDEDDLVELACIANGKRYDPSSGSFS
ncbi:hypothetical protein [Rhizobium sp. 'Codium 1']|uniref:hypothetical protein n=1 Tax=Rhizobium sp. 'Codium 1' TaxID=2940484 RepID=UPI001E535500|nr:hypothetical protein [Rhizobium sp. 'Codium 1']MCC8932929.1 hypothetical protein [Rhizobium sp. 'Codium 1']